MLTARSESVVVTQVYRYQSSLSKVSAMSDQIAEILKVNRFSQCHELNCIRPCPSCHFLRFRGHFFGFHNRRRRNSCFGFGCNSQTVGRLRFCWQIHGSGNCTVSGATATVRESATVQAHLQLLRARLPPARVQPSRLQEQLQTRGNRDGFGNNCHRPWCNRDGFRNSCCRFGNNRDGFGNN